ncbi:imidazolonepropionase [Zhouia sp. PK063]|uniref:imidazolonepropionase n=1 Tax=Zhouia sp. PK063 TaxID=3373602 RepID=UPI0037BCF5CF
MTVLFTNIKELIQVRDKNVQKVSGKAMKELPTIKNAFLYIENDTIIDFGTMDELQNTKADDIIDCTGKMILPTWCDSHTHLVYAGNREQEFIDRINGLTYQEIAHKGGGIVNSAKKLQETSEDELYEQSKNRLLEVIQMGTGAIEIKSGYGLTTAAELKMLQVVKRLKQEFSIPIKTTFLAAHALPPFYKNNKNGFMKLVIEEMLPKVAEQKLADFIDIFCEKGYFDIDDTHELLKAANKYQLKAKIHVNQFNSIGGIQTAVQHQALSVDHLEVMTEEDIQTLKASNTMPVALPSCSYFLSIPYTPARRLIDEGMALALATDYNPGSTPSGNMNFVVATACIKMKLTPEEAINAATLNGAFAMELSHEVGSITKGKKANFIITKNIPSYGYLPYAFGSNNIECVFINGKRIA